MPIGKPASGTVLGYLYQFERALFWLSIKEIDFVSIETEDDVVASLAASPISQIFEQDKHSIGDSNPFSDKNVNLWKTFEIWCNIEKNNRHTKFRLMYSSNKKYDTKHFIYKLAKRNVDKNYSVEEIDKLFKEFNKIGTSLEGEAKNHYDNIVRDYDEKSIKRMLSLVMINSDGLYNDNQDFKEHVLTNLRVSESFVKNELYQHLLGWLVDETCTRWKQKDLGIIYSSDILTVKDQYIAKFNNKPFIEQAANLLPLREITSDDHEENFVKQLNLIEASEEQKINAILDFQRANLERDRWAKSGTIPFRSHIDAFDEDLRGHWDMISELENIQNQHLEGKQRGKIIYLRCQNNSDFKIANYKVEQKYTVKGSFQILSNQLQIGWHPNWKEDLKDE
nr:ABC-three component system protein [uncultured Sphingobacterium sp.]